MKIVIFEIEDWERHQFQELVAEHELVFVREPLTPKNAADYADALAISSLALPGSWWETCGRERFRAVWAA